MVPGAPTSPGSPHVPGAGADTGPPGVLTRPCYPLGPHPLTRATARGPAVHQLDRVHPVGSGTMPTAALRISSEVQDRNPESVAQRLRERAQNERSVASG